MAEMTDATPASRDLRNFRLVLGALFAAFFGALPYVDTRHLHFWPFILAVLLWTVAWSRPSILRSVPAGWTRLEQAPGCVNTRIVLHANLRGFDRPVGLVMRLFGRDRKATLHLIANAEAIAHRATIGRRAAWRARSSGDVVFDLLRDLRGFARERKKFWLVPMIAVLLLLSLLVALSQYSAVAPFIYALF